MELTFTKSSGSFAPTAFGFQFYTNAVALASYGTGYPGSGMFPVPTTTTPSAAPVITWTVSTNGDYFVIINNGNAPTYLQEFEWTGKKNGNVIFQIVSIATVVGKNYYRIYLNAATSFAVSCSGCSSIAAYNMAADTNEVGSIINTLNSQSGSFTASAAGYYLVQVSQTSGNGNITI